LVFISFRPPPSLSDGISNNLRVIALVFYPILISLETNGIVDDYFI